MFNLKKYQQSLPLLQENEASLDFLVPEIVKTWGEVVGTTYEDETAMSSTYAEFASTVAHLLGLTSVDTISEDAVSSAQHKWTSTVNPWVAVGSRVEALHRAYRQEEDVTRVAESLWAALEFRSKALTGLALDKVLG